VAGFDRAPLGSGAARLGVWMEDFVVGGQRLRYELHGEGEPVVTVNNLAAPMEYWWPTPYLPTLTAAGYQVITFQHLGPKPPTLIDVAAD